MNYLKFVPVLFLAIVFLAACDDKDNRTSDRRDTSEVTDRDMDRDKDTAAGERNAAVTSETSSGKYFCTMHPLQQADNDAAKCAICKMKLTDKDKHNETVDKKVDEMKEKIKDKDNMSYDEISVARYRSDACEKYIKDAISKSGAVSDYYIDILEPSVHVVYDKSKTSKDKIEDAISAAGFDPKDDEKNASVKLPDDCYEKPPTSERQDGEVKEPQKR